MHTRLSESSVTLAFRELGEVTELTVYGMKQLFGETSRVAVGENLVVRIWGMLLGQRVKKAILPSPARIQWILQVTAEMPPIGTPPRFSFSLESSEVQEAKKAEH